MAYLTHDELWRDLGVLDAYEMRLVQGFFAETPLSDTDKMMLHVFQLVRRDHTNLITLNAVRTLSDCKFGRLARLAKVILSEHEMQTFLRKTKLIRTQECVFRRISLRLPLGRSHDVQRAALEASKRIM